MSYNERTITLKLQRKDVCDILIILGMWKKQSERWEELYKKVCEQLGIQDEKDSCEIQRGDILKEFTIKYRMFQYIPDEKEITVIANTKEEALREAIYKQIPYIEGSLPCSVYIKAKGQAKSEEYKQIY